MRVSVYPTRRSIDERDIKDRVAVVIDVLRATSTIITALYNGCKEIIPMVEIEEAVNISKNYEEDTFILGGERNAEKIEGFHLSNSPLEYTKEQVEEKTVLLTTTNGTRAIKKVWDAKEIILASFINITSVCKHIKDLGQDIVIVCAGTLGRFSTDDILVAGALIQGLEDNGIIPELDDLGHMSQFMYAHNRKDIHGILAKTRHYSRLQSLGLQGDLDYCLKLDTAPIVPICRDGVIRCQEPHKTGKI
ncbi:MAG TPA: 2-phosphosulfolactate phosphatase [Clostridia bacterium]|nr:2-phosphosulfolactate phosphatase [Clostridia bacterium]